MNLFTLFIILYYLYYFIIILFYIIIYLLYYESTPLSLRQAVLLQVYLYSGRMTGCPAGII